MQEDIESGVGTLCICQGKEYKEVENPGGEDREGKGMEKKGYWGPPLACAPPKSSPGLLASCALCSCTITTSHTLLPCPPL